MPYEPVLACGSPARIAYGGRAVVRSHAGVPRATDRDLVRPGGRHDHVDRAAGDPASAVRARLLGYWRSCVVAGDLCRAAECGRDALAAPLPAVCARSALVENG